MIKIYRGIYVKFHMNMCKDPEQWVTELIGTCKITDQEHIKLSTRAHERTHGNTCTDPQEHAQESTGACMDPGEYSYIQEICMCFGFPCRLGYLRWTGKANRSLKAMPEYPVAVAWQATQCKQYECAECGPVGTATQFGTGKTSKFGHTTGSFTSL
jgi:hypothetical protein